MWKYRLEVRAWAVVSDWHVVRGIARAAERHVATFAPVRFELVGRKRDTPFVTCACAQFNPHLSLCHTRRWQCDRRVHTWQCHAIGCACDNEHSHWDMPTSNDKAVLPRKLCPFSGEHDELPNVRRMRRQVDTMRHPAPSRRDSTTTNGDTANAIRYQMYLMYYTLI